MTKILKVSTLLIGLALEFVGPGFAATTTVQVGSVGLSFTPATASINTGDRVIWVWSGISSHSSTSDTGLWDSGPTVTAPHSFTNTFNSAGNFPYHCSNPFHGSMTGSIIVAAPNPPPTVSITNPVSGTVLTAPANVTIRASATDDGTVTNVQFRIGATVLTNKETPPFFAVTNNLPAGNYTLTAIASDNLGAKATNTVNFSVVTPPTLAISNPQLSVGDFHFS